jgi:hypothetical protein
MLLTAKEIAALKAAEAWRAACLEDCARLRALGLSVGEGSLGAARRASMGRHRATLRALAERGIRGIPAGDVAVVS